MPAEVDPHAHCSTCYDARCSNTACSVVSCELDGCGARFHACKLTEHNLLCVHAKVPCLNAAYGCPATVTRGRLPAHLPHCPASLVHCTMEWNRWPVCSSDRQSQQPVRVLTDLDGGQLDIALALRDQRVLSRSMRASARTRNILTNSLNRRHPAVPLEFRSDSDNAGSATLDECQEMDNLLRDMHLRENEPGRQNSRSPAGLRKSICDELFRATRDTVQQLSDAVQIVLDGAPSTHTGESPNHRQDFSLGSSEYPYIHCVHCERRKERLERLIDSRNAMKDDDVEVGGRTGDGSSTTDVIAGMTEGTNGEEVLSMNYDPLAPPTNTEHRKISTSSSSSDDSILPPPAVFMTPSTTGHVSASTAKGIVVIEPPAVTVETRPSSASPTQQTSLSLDLSLESITRYQAKPDSMYTFLCAQVFRRDEFSWHFQNVHSDIHGGLNGWLEQRCPLAPYGCTYSQRRFHPGRDSRARVVYSKALESFGIRPDGGRNDDDVRPTRTGEASGPIEMEWVGVSTNGRADLPVDGRSDDNRCGFQLSQTSDRDAAKRNVLDDERSGEERTSDLPCLNGDIDRSFLPADAHDGNPMKPPVEPSSGGVVAGGRETVAGDGRHDGDSPDDLLVQLPSELLRYLTRFLDGFSLCNLALASKLLRQVCCSVLEDRGMVVQHWVKEHGWWKVAYRVWYFSTAFTPVTSWGFEDQPSLSVHLAQCPYNIQRRQETPVQVMITGPKEGTKPEGTKPEGTELEGTDKLERKEVTVCDSH